MNRSKRCLEKIAPSTSDSYTLKYEDSFKLQSMPRAKKLKITKCPSLKEVSEKLQNMVVLLQRNIIFVTLEINQGINNINSLKCKFDSLFPQRKIVMVLESGDNCAILWKLSNMEVFFCLEIVKAGLENAFEFIYEFIFKCVEENHNG